MSFTRQSRFMRSMTPSGSVKMSTSRFNMVCGKTVEQAVRPNLDRIPNPQAPKVLDSRVLTPSVTRRGLERERERGRSQTRDSYGLQTCGRPPVAPAAPSSLHVPFGSYAEKGIHSRPGRYASTTQAPVTHMMSRRSVTPGPGAGGALYSSQVSHSSGGGYSSSRRNSVSLSSSSMSMTASSSRQRHMSASYGTPAASRGLPFY